jgi:aldehyde:ferredoxin oxidoreductase
MKNVLQKKGKRDEQYWTRKRQRKSSIDWQSAELITNEEMRQVQVRKGKSKGKKDDRYRDKKRQNKENLGWQSEGLLTNEGLKQQQV